MGWILAYFVGAIVIPTFYYAILLSNSSNKIELVRSEDALKWGAMHLFWIIWIPIDIAKRSNETYKEHVTIECKRIMASVFGRDRDRYSGGQHIVDIDESDLKML